MEETTSNPGSLCSASDLGISLPPKQALKGLTELML